VVRCPSPWQARYGGIAVLAAVVIVAACGSAPAPLPAPQAPPARPRCGGPVLALGAPQLQRAYQVTAMLAAGTWLYATTTRARNRTGSITFWALVVFLFVMYFATAFGPPPPSVEALKWMGLIAWLFIPWGWWIDRNRTAVAR